MSLSTIRDIVIIIIIILLWLILHFVSLSLASDGRQHCDYQYVINIIKITISIITRQSP